LPSFIDVDALLKGGDQSPGPAVTRVPHDAVTTLRTQAWHADTHYWACAPGAFALVGLPRSKLR
jgi:hypothetical protein